MRAHIKATKEDIKSKDPLLRQIVELSINVNEVGDSYQLSPKPGRLFDLLKLLRENQVDYSTDFDIDDEIVTSGPAL